MFRVTRTNLALVLALALVLLVLSCLQVLPIAQADGGNASVTRTGNLQFFPMSPGPGHPPGNASVTRTGNLQFFPMTSPGPLSTTIDSFTTTALGGNPQTSFHPGNTTLFKIVIEGTAAQNIPNALVSVMIKDNNEIPIFIGYVYENINVGSQVTVYLGFQIPYGSTLGYYEGTVCVFTLLLSQGGSPITGGHATVNFTVS